VPAPEEQSAAIGPACFVPSVAFGRRAQSACALKD
jgi:hypothetical protein